MTIRHLSYSSLHILQSFCAHIWSLVSPLPPTIHLHFHAVLGEYVFDFAVVIFGVSVDILFSYTPRHPNSPALVFFREKALTYTSMSLATVFYFHYPRKLYTKKCKTMEPIAKSANALRSTRHIGRTYTEP